MALSSLQPSMDSSDWLHAPSSSSGATVASSRSSMEKRLKPHQDQALIHCPRCDSTNTKFCYYNNYSLSQPRYFCKSCRRYWTKGGTLRNIPVGGVCRKNKKLSSTSKKPNNNTTHHRYPPPPHNVNPDANGVNRPNSGDLQLSYPASPMEFSAPPHFMFENLCNNPPTAIDFMENGGGGGGECETGDCFPAVVATGGYGAETVNARLTPETVAFDDEYYETMMNEVDVKPRVFAFGWQDQPGCYADLHGSGSGRNGYLLGLGSSWAGLMNGYGSSAADPFV